MPNPKPKIVYPFNRQYSMSAAKVCWVNSVACNLLYHITSTHWNLLGHRNHNSMSVAMPRLNKI